MGIKEQLLKLSREEIDDIIRYANGIRGIAPKAIERTVSKNRVVGADRFDYVLHVVCDICRERGLGSEDGVVIDVAVAKRLSAYTTFRKEIPMVIKYIESFTPNRTYQKAILRMGYAYLVEDRVVQHVGGLLLMTAQIPTALNQMFPGYYPAGLMPVVVKRLGARE